MIQAHRLYYLQQRGRDGQEIFDTADAAKLEKTLKPARVSVTFCEVNVNAQDIAFHQGPGSYPSANQKQA